MLRQNFSGTLLAFLTLALASTAFAASDHFKTVYSFKGGPDGMVPSPVVMDSAGNLYGTVQSGGTNNQNCYLGCGAVFELSPTTAGCWTKKTLYRFTGDADGGNPFGGVVLDAAGNLFGTTGHGGGTISACSGGGCGTIFELSPTATGWAQKTLYSFTGGADGGQPLTLIEDASGNLYGVTQVGGNGGGGTVFELSPDGSGGWIESTAYALAVRGLGPTLMIDSSGNLFGTTSAGGNLKGSCATLGCGTVFELSPASGGGFNFTEIFVFPNASTGRFPGGRLLEDSTGHLFGTTAAAENSFGTVFKLTNSTSGWTRNVISLFNNTKGAEPEAGVVEDASGNLYGTTAGGDCGNGAIGCGTVFKLTPSTSGGWSRTLLHRFTGGVDGTFPTQLLIDSSGNLFGPTLVGGNKGSICGSFGGCGTIFEVIP